MFDLISIFEARKLRRFSAGPLWFRAILRVIFWIGRTFESAGIYKFTLSKFLSVGWFLVDGRSGRFLTGFPLSLASVFLIILAMNVIGCVPNRFCVRAHIAFGFRFSFLVCIALWVSRVGVAPLKRISALIPVGTPEWLCPYVWFIELVRIGMRPLTVGLRLIINLTAGHIILLIGRGFGGNLLLSGAHIFNFFALKWQYVGVGAWSGLWVFEVCVAFFQAIIFCMLLGLYSDDHNL